MTPTGRQKTSSRATRGRRIPLEGAADDGYELQPELGARLREIRRDRGLSIAEVAEATGISRSFLSLVETGRSEITIGRLIRLVNEYHVHVGEFLEGLSSRGSTDLVRHGQRRHIRSAEEGLDVWLLAPDEQRSMLPMLVEFAPGGGLAEMGRHEGEEFVHVIEGELVVELEGRPPLLLGVGDTAWYAGNTGHELRNESESTTRAIAVMAPPNL